MSTDQEEQLSSYENQVQYYTEMISNNPEYELVDIYADEGISGTNTKKRDEFNRMIDDCRLGYIDIVVTKSISRFARNTLDCLNYVRELKEKGICIIFEKENINTLDAKGEVLLTILSSLAQDESRSLSENCTWGIRRRFEQGKHKPSTKRFLGYDYDTKTEKLVVNREQAKVVKRIYEEFLNGHTVDTIARMFKAEKVKSWDGNSNWQPSAIKSMLRNEKYMGDVILQKSYTTDFLTKKRVKNNGELQMYRIEEDHEPIIDRETWNAVQQEFERRDLFIKEHRINAYSQEPETNPLFGKVICGECGATYGRVIYKSRSGTEVKKFRCGSCNKANGHKVCGNRYILEDAIIKLFVMGWNAIAEHPKKYESVWKKNLKSGNELLDYKTRQIMEAAKKGPIKDFDPWLMIRVMDIITVYENGNLTIRFYDGTEFSYEAS